MNKYFKRIISRENKFLWKNLLYLKITKYEFTLIKSLLKNPNSYFDSYKQMYIASLRINLHKDKFIALLNSGNKSIGGLIGDSINNKIVNINWEYFNLNENYKLNTNDTQKISDLIYILKYFRIPSMIFDSCIYYGEILCGAANGKGIFHYKNGNKCIGNFKNNKIHGQAISYFANGCKYVGNYENDKREGNGTFYYSNGDTCVGMFENGLQINGIHNYGKDHKYIGNIRNDVENGLGIYYWGDGQKYVGNFKNGDFEGKGIMYLVNGTQYIANFKDSKSLKKYYFSKQTLIDKNISEMEILVTDIPYQNYFLEIID